MTASITKTINRFTKKHVLHKNVVKSKIKHSVNHNIIIVNLTTITTPNHEKVISLKIECTAQKLEIDQFIYFSITNFSTTESKLFFIDQIKYPDKINPISLNQYHLWRDQRDRLSQQYSIRLYHIDILHEQHPKKTAIIGCCKRINECG